MSQILMSIKNVDARIDALKKQKKKKQKKAKKEETTTKPWSF